MKYVQIKKNQLYSWASLSWAAFCFHVTTLNSLNCCFLCALHSLNVQNNIHMYIGYVLFCLAHYRSFFFLSFHIFSARPKQTWNLWINAIIWFLSVLFQFSCAVYRLNFSLWTCTMCAFFRSSSSDVIAPTVWNAFNLFRLYALTYYIDAIAKSSNSSRYITFFIKFNP